jgi:hypothetical protein
MIHVPPPLLWDYEVAPDDKLWQLQRILDFFPTYGRDRATTMDLVEHLDALRAPPEVKALVRLYADHYEGR